MAEAPAIKIKTDYEDPPNISAEVPGQQKLREMDPSDVEKYGIKNGGHRISYTEEKTVVQADGQTITRTVSTTEKEVTRGVSTSEEKNAAPKKSRIPLMKFKQTAEKVQKERQKNLKEQSKHRRSSIPKLKDAKAVKRTSSLKAEQKLDDEFDRIYEEIVVNRRSIVDDKILPVSIDDPEKVETKFEEIINAYDSNEDNYLTPSEKLKICKIPWRKKDNSNSAVEKTKTPVTNSKLMDGGFKVSATTITTKRFSRGSSMDLSKSQTLDVVETNIEQNPQDTVSPTHIDSPEEVKTNSDTLTAELSVDKTDGVVIVNKMDDVEHNRVEKMEIEEIDGGRKITKTTITRIPVKPERVNRSISRELNKRPISLDDRDIVNREVTRHEEFIDGTRKTVIRETLIKEPQVKSEKMTRSISRTFSRDGNSVTISSKNRLSYKEDATKETALNNASEKLDEFIDDLKPSVNQNDIKVETNTKVVTKISAPVINKTTHSFVKGTIKNVERSKSVEWKAADEIVSKKYTRTYSENKFTKHNIDDQQPEAITENNKVIINEISESNTKSDTLQTADNTRDDEKYTEITEDAENQKAVVVVNADISVVSDIVDPPNESIIEELTEEKLQISEQMPVEEKNSKETTNNKEKGINMQNVTILKGNVNRLITQLIVKDDTDTKKEAEQEVKQPKKKSVLSKIAMFEGKGAYQTIQEKKESSDRKTTSKTEHINIQNNVVTTQPELDFLNNNVNVLNGSSEVIAVDDAPVIVDQIFKYQEENISTIQQVQEVKMLPEAIDLTVSESSVATIKDTSGASSEDFKGEILSFKHSEEDLGEPPKLPEAINVEQNEVQTAVILPAHIDVPNNNKANILKYSYEKATVDDNDSKKQKLKVGKLNLDLWNKKVQDNKQLVSKIKPIEIKTQKNTTSTKAIYKQETEKLVVNKTETQNDQPVPLEKAVTTDISVNKIPVLQKLKSEEHEIPIILPVKIDYTVNNEKPKTVPGKVEFGSNEKLQVPVILPETPLTLAPKVTFERQRSHIEVPAVSYTTESYTNIYRAEVNDIKQESKTLIVSKTIQEQKTEEKVIEIPQILPITVEFTSSETTFEESSTLEDLPPLPTTPIPIEPSEINGLSNEFRSKDGTVKNDLNATRNIAQNDIHDYEYDAENLDKKRTKSLAELDLGDAVKGQVKRMVYRIKSVDFERIESSRSRKISLREMPKKSSVLEKIALFEGRATTPITTTSKPINIGTNKNVQPSTQALTEEMYLLKTEELSTVKLRYPKTEMLYLSLGNGDQMPAIALGTALLDSRLAPHVVSAAIDLGYRAIDTAYIYGNEQLVGQGIKKKIDDGTVTRGDLFIMGKLWSTFHKPELVESACRASLEALGLDYFDLYMIHNPMSLKEGGDPIPQIANVLQFSEHDYLDAWFAMENLVTKGLVKAIGLSNFNSQQIQRILDRGHVKPLVNQVECHPYLSQQPLQAFCNERNITLSCYSVLGSKGTPAEYKTGISPVIDDPLVTVMASGLNVTPAQLLVRYQIQSGRQAVVKATSSGHLYDILQALTFVLEPHQIDALNALNRNKRNFDMKKFGELHKNYPFNVPF